MRVIRLASARILALGLALSAAQLAAAQPSGAEQGWYARIGVMGLAVPEYEGADGYKFRALPLAKITYDNRYFLSHQGLGINLVDQDGLDLAVAVNYDGGRNTGNKKALAGYRSIGDTAVGRLLLDYRIGAVKLHADITSDILGSGHGGTQATVGIAGLFELSPQTTLIVGPSLTWASSDYMHRYFSTTSDRLTTAALAGEVVPGSPTGYRAANGLKNAGLSALAFHEMGDHWSIIGHAGYSRLLSKAADSPFVKDNGSRDQFSAGLGLAYTF